MTTEETKRPLLMQMTGIEKSFPGVKALDGVSFDLYRGETHVLLGENGAGKSTLIKILSGVFRPDAGSIAIDERVTDIHNPAHARSLGISTIFQEFSLVPSLSVAENIVLGREPTLWGSLFLDKRARYEIAAKALELVAFQADPNMIVRNLVSAERQLVEIAKSLVADARIIIMDEPTAALSEMETENLFSIIRRLNSKQVSIIYITHRLEDVRRIGDRVTVIRDGRNIDTIRADQIQDISILVTKMVGSEVSLRTSNIEQRADQPTDDTPVLRVENLSRKGALRNVSFELYRGEILGITGLLGAGRTELARVIFGVDRPDRGRIWLCGREIIFNNPRQAVSAGIGLVSEDRRYQGLVPVRSVKENISLAALSNFTSFGFIKHRQEAAAVKRFVDELAIRTTSVSQLCANLSGGNQQKVVVAKWLCAHSRLLIFDEPTKGVDVAAKAEIHRLMRDLVSKGVGVIMITSELPELLAISDRIMVMCKGSVTAILNRNEASKDKIMKSWESVAS
jgi:ribose transport system ATP-binding protein